MAAHSSTLAWKVPWAEEPGRLQSMGSWRVRHDWDDLAAAAAMSQSSQVIRWVKNLPAMQDTQEMQVRSLGWEDTLEKLSILEFNQANRGSLCVWLAKHNCSACIAWDSGLISWQGGSLVGFLELRQAPGVYSRVSPMMPILNGSLFSEVRTLV